MPNFDTMEWFVLCRLCHTYCKTGRRFIIQRTAPSSRLVYWGSIRFRNTILSVTRFYKNIKLRAFFNYYYLLKQFLCVCLFFFFLRRVWPVSKGCLLLMSPDLTFAGVSCVFWRGLLKIWSRNNDTLWTSPVHINDPWWEGNTLYSFKVKVAISL
jgi:hypothetical protein